MYNLHGSHVTVKLKNVKLFYKIHRSLDILQFHTYLCKVFTLM